MDLPQTPESEPESAHVKPPAEDSPEVHQQKHAPPSEEPRLASEEDIPLDGPDPEGEKMIDDLALRTGQTPRPGT